MGCKGSSTFSLTWARGWGWVVSATPRPIYPRPQYRRLGGPWRLSGRVRKISLPPGFDPRRDSQYRLGYPGPRRVVAQPNGLQFVPCANGSVSRFNTTVSTVHALPQPEDSTLPLEKRRRNDRSAADCVLSLRQVLTGCCRHTSSSVEPQTDRQTNQMKVDWAFAETIVLDRANGC